MNAHRRSLWGPLLLLVVAVGCQRRPYAPIITPMPDPPIAQVTKVDSMPIVVPAATQLLDARSVISAMYDRYAATWYRTLTFVQKTTVALASGGELVQTWYEAVSLPGHLRIDTDLLSKSGVLYARDSIFRFGNGKLAAGDTGVNDLLVLGFDVYAQPAPMSEASLRRLGFDLTTMHEDAWRGKPVYVVGAAAGDSTSKQFWIEKERMLVVRMIQRNARRGMIDTRFDQYAPAGRGWIAMRVEQFVNGKRMLLQEYSDVKVNVELSSDLFDPQAWATAKHWMR